MLAMAANTLRELLTMLERGERMPEELLTLDAYRGADPLALAWDHCDDAAAMVWALQLRGAIDTDTIELLVERGVRPYAFVRCSWWKRPVQRDLRVCWAVRLVLPAPTLAELVAMPMRARVGRG